MTKQRLKHIVRLTLSIILVSSCRKVNDDCNISVYQNTPEKKWFTSHKGSEEESHGHFILTCSDGGFLQVGETGSISKSSKILIQKTNSSGSLLWSKEISEGNHNLGNSALEVNDGYLICGALNKNSALIKLNKTDGSVIFNRSINNGGSDAFEHAVITSSGITAIGYKNAEDDGNTFYTQGKGYITFLNTQGEKISGADLALSHPYRIKSYNNESFISGLTDGANDYGLIKINNVGNVIWSKKFGGANADHCFGMDISADGSIFLTGHTLSGTENWDTHTLKINTNGSQIWSATTGNPRGFKPKFIHDEAWGIQSTNDGGCIVVAGTGDEYGRYRRRCGNNGDNSNTWHVYTIKYDSIGKVEWQCTYGGDKGKDWAGEDIDLTSDGGVIIAVDNGEFGFLRLEPFQ
ncbi:MAG: hypothetical protein MK066_03870 [Crocinitomicaceae bacterium]|nr:hypothetical protein [Crocinitomicaceae bacterium]